MNAEADSLRRLATLLQRDNHAFKEATVEVMLQGFNSPLAGLIANSEDDLVQMFASASSANQSRSQIVQSIREKADVRSFIATVGMTKDYSNGGYSSQSSIEYFCTLDPAKMTSDSWEGLWRAGYIDYELYSSTLRTMWLYDASQAIAVVSSLYLPELWAVRGALPRIGQLLLRSTQVGAAKSLAKGVAPAVIGPASYLKFGPYDLVYGPKALGALRAFQAERGGLLIEDVVSRNIYDGVGIRELTLIILKQAAKSRQQVHWDLTHMDDIANLLARKGKYADAITSLELRFIRDNWDEFLVKPKFYRNGIEVGRPW